MFDENNYNYHNIYLKEILYNLVIIITYAFYLEK